MLVYKPFFGLFPPAAAVLAAIIVVVDFMYVHVVYFVNSLESCCYYCCYLSWFCCFVYLFCLFSLVVLYYFKRKRFLNKAKLQNQFDLIYYGTALSYWFASLV